MATALQILALRRAINEPDASTYTDTVLNDEYLTARDNSVEAAAADIWEEKAARAAELVDVTESGSSRRMSQIHEQALKMAAYWRSQTAEEEAAVDINQFPMTRRIVR